MYPSVDLNNPDMDKSDAEKAKEKLQHEVGTEASESSKNQDENQIRGNWSNQAEFLLMCIGYAVGLGNLWRFPYLCMRNGGGAFLIPYFTFLMVCGIPLFYLELVIGQFSSLSPTEVWRLCPLFKGLGWGAIIVSSIVCVYYNLIVSWVLYYLGVSFTKEVPWATCDHPWNTELCVMRSSGTDNATTEATLNYTDSTELSTNLDISNLTWYNISSNVSIEAIVRSPAEEFWEYNVLERSSGIGELGGIRWQLALCLVASWVLVFFCLAKGIKSSGKVVYVTATFPYVFLTCLLIRGLLLPGAADGIKYYLTPNFKQLFSLKTWVEACLQIFYSLGPAWGSLITMASYNKFNHNCMRDAIIIPLVNCGTSFFAGFVIFSILGFMAKDAGLTVEDVVTSGPGLVFIAYPEAIARMPLSPVWAVMFFLMLLNIGLGSQFAMFEALVSGVVDLYPRKLTRWKPLITGLLCLLFLIIGMPFVTRAGLYYFQIMDWYCAMFSVTIIAFLECIVLSRLYGWERVYEDITLMLGKRPHQIWRIHWCYITPIMLAVVIVFSCTQLSEPTYGDYEYPRWAIGFGWMLAMVSLMPLPIMAVMTLRKETGTLWQRIRKSVRPAPDWGPALDKYRTAYQHQLKHLNFHDSDKLSTDEEDLKSNAVV